MRYLIYVLGTIFVIYKVAVYFRHNIAVDTLHNNHQFIIEEVSRLAVIVKQSVT